MKPKLVNIFLYALSIIIFAAGAYVMVMQNLLLAIDCNLAAIYLLMIARTEIQ